MYNIGICDDGKNVCSSLEKMILQYAGKKKIPVEIKVWYTGEGLCDYLKERQQIDILFLDIELFRMTGIEAGDFIRNRLEDRSMQIIYNGQEINEFYAVITVFLFFCVSCWQKKL